MHANTEPDGRQHPSMVLNPKLLLGIYAILPVALLFLGLDWLVSDLRFSRGLPSDPHQIQWFNMFFMLPHIFASLFTFMNRDYLRAYSPRLQVSIPAIATTIVVLPWTLGVTVFAMLIATYTVYHTINQQTGVAALLARNKSTSYQVWRWMSFAVMAFVYIAGSSDSPLLKNFIVVAFPVFLMLFGIASLVTARQSKTPMGRLYIAANAVMVIACYALQLANLPFFTILIPRVVHDITAFVFYVSHNANRDLDKPSDIMATLQRRAQIPEYIFTPLLGIGCTVIVTCCIKEYFPYLVAFLALFHYYWEGVMWKKGSPHRAYIYV